MNPLDSLGDEVNELVSSFASTPIAGNLETVGFTQYGLGYQAGLRQSQQ